LVVWWLTGRFPVQVHVCTIWEFEGSFPTEMFGGGYSLIVQVELDTPSKVLIEHSSCNLPNLSIEITHNLRFNLP
jgi:hypothetical protein